MFVVDIRPIEECLDGFTVKNYVLSEPTTEAQIRCLGTTYRLEYFQFARPFYRIRAEGKFTVKGVTGSNEFQAIYERFSPVLEEEICGRLCDAGK